MAVSPRFRRKTPCCDNGLAGKLGYFEEDIMTALASTTSHTDLPKYFPQMFEKFQSIERGQITITLPDGHQFCAQGSQSGPVGHLNVTNDQLFTRVVREGNLGFAEAYLDGWWNTPDLQAFMDVLVANMASISQPVPGSSLVRWYEVFRHWLLLNTQKQAPKNLAKHYELGNSFYGAWLDETMSYSSGIFENPHEDLEIAQRRKIKRMCDSINLKEEDRFMDIGCGWGALAIYAAKERGAKVTALTLSKAHFEHTSALVQKEGLSERVEVALRDYRDETGTYEGIGSIEMIEHVGEKYWPVYFKSIHDRLSDNGRATVQAITIADDLYPTYRTTQDFIRKHIFPGGMLPYDRGIREMANASGLKIVDCLSFPDSYSITLRRWNQAFDDAWSEIESMAFDQRFKRLWNYYLTMCAAGHEYGATSVTQYTFARV
ncbi:SAM-dependent methyltransferase [Roseinatronobacter ekhonensis]|nr:cyclopropane-fatty-acyl-phospholipid synthase family protein [Roseibaca ekhonensis]